MIQPLCPPVRCYLTASYLLSSFPDRGSPHLHTPSFAGSLVEEELLSSTTTTTTVFLHLCSPRGWINCCVFDIHSLSGPGRRRRDERIKRKVTERLVLVCVLPLSPKLLLDSTCTAKNIIPPPPMFLSLLLAEKVDIVLQGKRNNVSLFPAFSPPSKWRMARKETLRRCSIHSEFLCAISRFGLIDIHRILLRCQIFNAPIEGWKMVRTERFLLWDIQSKWKFFHFLKIHRVE